MVLFDPKALLAGVVIKIRMANIARSILLVLRDSKIALNAFKIVLLHRSKQLGTKTSFLGPSAITTTPIGIYASIMSTAFYAG